MLQPAGRYAHISQTEGHFAPLLEGESHPALARLFKVLVTDEIHRQHLTHEVRPKQGWGDLLRRGVFEGSAIVIAWAGRVTWIHMNRTQGGENAAWGWTLTAANMAVFGVLIALCLRNIVRDLTQRRRPEEEELLPPGESGLARLTRAGKAFLLGEAATVPFAVLMWDFNEGVWQPIGVATQFTSDAAIPIYSAYLGLMPTKRQTDAVSQQLDQIRDLLVGAIEAKRADLIDHAQEVLNWLDENERGEGDEWQKTYRALMFFFDPEFEEEPIYTEGDMGQMRCRTQAFGYLMVGAQLVMNGAISYSGFNRLIQHWLPMLPSYVSMPVSALGALFVMWTNYKIYKTQMAHTAVGIWDELAGAVGGTRRPRLYQARIWLKGSLTLLQLGCVALSYAPSVQASETYFYSLFQWPMKVLSTASTYVLGWSVLSQAVNGLISLNILHCGRPEERRAVYLMEDLLGQFLEAFKKSPPIQVARMLSATLQRDLDRLLGDLTITHEELHLYILEHSGRGQEAALQRATLMERDGVLIVRDSQAALEEGNEAREMRPLLEGSPSTAYGASPSGTGTPPLSPAASPIH